MWRSGLGDDDFPVLVYVNVNFVLLLYCCWHVSTTWRGAPQEEKTNGRQVVELLYGSDPGRRRKGSGDGRRALGLACGVHGAGGLAQLAQHLLGLGDLALNLRQLVV